MSIGWSRSAMRSTARVRNRQAEPSTRPFDVTFRAAVTLLSQAPASRLWDMQVNRSYLADFSYFLAIAKHRSFRRAGLELGVSASALSHALKGLEEGLGVRLLNRTNRSVTLTAAGEELHAAIRGPFDAIGEAVEGLNRFRDAPAGRIRLNVVGDAGPLLLGPVLPVFIERFPDIEVEIASSNRMVDVTEAGYDAGIRYGGAVPEDIVAPRFSPHLPLGVTGLPPYLQRVCQTTPPKDLPHQPIPPP